MSDVYRYDIKPGEDGYEIAVSLGGEWVRFDDYAALHYERIHDLNQIGGLQEENARLKAEVERLEHQVRYWRIEAECDHGRWLRCLEDLEKLRSKPSV